MIDWHSHVLPSVDDGSKSVEESKEMLAKLSEQGVSTVIATPHYDADRESPSAFIARRTVAYNMLMEAQLTDAPRILCGAEVRYYAGISKLEYLKALCIADSDILLLEMPFAPWTEMMIDEVIHISATRGVTVMLAHIERYFRFTSNATWSRLSAEGILLQTNASFYTALGSRHKAMSMLKDGITHTIGSDCHNMTSRPPLIGQAYRILSKKYGTPFLHWLFERDNNLLT